MRNLKRALSLGLTAAMISGLMVMGSSAASSSYTDVADTDNVEAIEVLKTVGIMVGDENGDFNPDANVTRNEMAVVMSNLMAYNVATYKNTSPFTDVPAWAEPYVAACWTNGITAGYDADTYGGADTVTTAQAALMVMKALGYFQYSSDFGNDWQLSTVAQGNKIDLFEDVNSGVQEAMTRNDVAQLVLNALEAGTVEAEKSGQDITVGDITITSGVTYKYITSGRDYAYAINDKLDTNNDGSYSSGAIVELGEKLYQGDLTKEDGYDDFGRPAAIWDYQSKEIGTFAETADYTFTSKVTSKDLYNEVGKTATDNYTWSVTLNGDNVKYDGDDLNDNRSDDDKDFIEKAGVALDDIYDGKATGNGVVTQVYVDGSDKTVDVAIIYYYAAEVLEYDEEDGTITLSDLDEGPAKNTDEFDATNFAEDDIVIYSYANGDIQEVYAADELTGEVTRVRANTSDSDGDNFVVDGTTYNYNKTAVADRLTTDNVNNDVVAYLDANGYVAYIDESAVTYDYAYVLSMGTDNDQYGKGDDGKGTTVYARLVLTDGTIVKAETDVKASDYKEDKLPVGCNNKLEAAISLYENHIVSYTVDKNDVYSLKDRSEDDITVDTGLKIENGVASMDINFNGRARYTANANTIFIVADTDDDSFDDYDFTVYTGVKNVPDIEARPANAEAKFDGTQVVVAAEDDSNVAKVVYIEDADVSGTGEVIFVEANGSAKQSKDSDIGNWYEIDAVVDGEVTTLQVKENSTAAETLVKDLKSGETEILALKSITENSDGLVTSIKLYGTYDDGDGYITGVGTEKAEKSTVMLKSIVQLSNDNERFAWTDDVSVVRYDYKGDFSVSRISSIKDDPNDKYVAVLDGDVITGICILENDEDTGSDAELSDKVEVQDVDLTNGIITYYVESGAYTLTNDDILAILKDEGCTDISVNKGVWTYTTKSGLPTTNEITQRQVYEITAKANSGETLKVNDTTVYNGQEVTFTLANESGNEITNDYGTNSTCSVGEVTKIVKSDDEKSLTITVKINGLTKDSEASITLATGNKSEG
ncbi:S-layer homology domain-containing protein [Pseudoflavonifractor capillosus]|uniref:S-layer homology domain-containing protein n=1 Tax=Pseudoflavonifractor capillosus TaxID=106588 RepID=UPI00195B9ED1|nr:S-layer homology domain-containing protein [Pseudoflavonifractor capillosus]MBM6680785.1 S-layer homology domain-containing protein [Pseudoflavonifractor capillosus]